MSSKMFATESVEVVTPKERIQLLTHEEVDPKVLKRIPSGTLKSLRQTGRIVPESEYTPPAEPKPRKNDTGDIEKDEGSQRDAWLDSPVDSLDIENRLKSLLTEGGCQTVRQVLELGKNNDDGLKSIKGIAEPSEVAIQEAIAKLKPTEKPSLSE